MSATPGRCTPIKCAAAKTCDKKAVRKQWLEDLVVNETMKLVEDDASMNAIIAKVMELQNQESTDLPIYEKQLKETEVGITNMLNAIQMGILTSSTKERLEALEEQRKELQARIAEERLAKPKMKEEFVRFNRKGRFGILFRPAYFAICNPTMLQTIKKLDCDGCSVFVSWI